MKCLLLLGGAFGAGLWYLKKHRKSAVTPAAAAVHGHLMANEYRPDKLEHMAQLFGAEGLPDLAQEIAGKAKQIRMQADAIASLVERSRALDQNAMGMIAAVRDQAEAGNPRAQVSRALIARYCAAHPMPQTGPTGEMPVQDAA
jgi:hypothetical protein